MSGILKGDSIYKSGGSGGGGYKDGGQLVDADFIEVENNTISSYENVSRDPVNFVFTVKRGEVFNSIIEFTSDTNATLYVYKKEGEFYYLLGNVGGDTVTAGNDYIINIAGDSYSIEQVNDLSKEPALVDINGLVVSVFKYNNYLITGDLGRWFKRAEFEEFLSGAPGWQKVTRSVINSLVGTYGINALRSDNGWNGTQGTNTTGLSFYPYGVKLGGSIYYQGNESPFWAIDINDPSANYITIRELDIQESTFGPNEEIRGRLMKIL